MAHFLAPKPSQAVLPVFFNVDGVVGAPPAQNLREDVLLVQFVFKVIAVSSLPMAPELLAAAKAVQVTGSIDAATINAIRVAQQHLKKTTPGQVVDGRVSPVKGDYMYAQGVAWTIAHLNGALQKRSRDVWPRIDKIAGCPSELKQMVARTVVGE